MRSERWGCWFIRINVFIRRTPAICLSSCARRGHVSIQLDAAAFKPGRELSLEVGHGGWHPSLRIPAFKPVRNQCLLFKAPSLWYFVTATGADGDSRSWLRQGLLPVDLSKVWTVKRTTECTYCPPSTLSTHKARFSFFKKKLPHLKHLIL